jgi:hypothetical protein
MARKPVEIAALPAPGAPASPAERRPGPDAASTVDHETHDYGYVTGKTARPSSREKLVQIFSRGALHGNIDLVWTPETGGPVPPWDVPFLVEAFTERVRRGLRLALLYTGLGLLMAGVFLLPTWLHGERAPWVFLVLLGLHFITTLVVAVARVLTIRQSARALMAERTFVGALRASLRLH